MIRANKLVWLLLWLYGLLSGQEHKIPLSIVIEGLRRADLAPELVATGLSNFARRSVTPELEVGVMRLRDSQTEHDQRAHALVCLDHLAVYSSNPHDIGLILLGLYQHRTMNPHDPVYGMIVERVRGVMASHDTDGSACADKADEEHGISDFFDEKVTPCLTSTRRCIIAVVGLVVAVAGGIGVILGLLLPKSNEAIDFSSTS